MNHSDGTAAPITHKIFLLFFLSLILLCIPNLTGCSSTTAPYSQTGFYFNTVVTVTLYDRSQKPLLAQCFQLAQDYENRLSKTVSGSDIDRINHSNGTAVTVSADTVRLLNKALYYAELSNGGVDPTIGAVSSLWDFQAAVPDLPDAAALDAALAHVDYRVVMVDPEARTVTLTDPQAQIDLGFIAKGYIADRLKEFLIGQGVNHALINLGGNVLVIGSKPDGSPYQIGIQQPFAVTGTPALTIDLIDRSAVSSGNYERYFIKDKIIYHHILNTQTGYPIDNELNAVTILSADSVDGDALSTLVYALGLEKGTALIESLPDISAIFITKDGAHLTVS